MEVADCKVRMHLKIGLAAGIIIPTLCLEQDLERCK
jgi:hypothetical protein